ncbi:valine--tRNA ligase [Candidatus Woesearchaeota archaeon]|nr:MAG: valine--tRNA ligase [Candidatus Woesearchaeota archaeon]
MELPKKYNPQETEAKWQKYWLENNIFKYDENSDKEVYSIDTPPPYASADHLHVGHGMHYTQFEFVARYQRMKGKNVFFPMGYDDNGLPTERFVEKKHKVDKSKISRADFIKLCLEETEKTGKTYYDLFTSLGFSIDWSLLYHTIGDNARRVAQKSFITLYKKNRLERTDAPTIWCTHCQTTIAQAELENVELPSYFNDIIFKSGEDDLIISTTRPEMLPACVGLFFHPDDKRYKHLEGKMAKVPLFDYEVPILTDETVDIEKGTGLMMVCTFGDKEDVEKWKKYKLPSKIVFDEDGRMNEKSGKYKGLTIKEAREKIIEDLKDAKLLVKQEKIVHAVNVHERCGTEIEFLQKKQWEIKVLDKKHELIALASKINWYPQHMKVRYEHWVKNLQWNWGISRQRYYGVPFPVWYCKKCGEVLLPDENQLPVDPREQKFSGKCSCGSEEAEPEMDVMDTWMTSSCTPEINAIWGAEDERKNLIPMDLRPQAHDIIRTWAFYTIVKSYYHRGDIPWKDIMISGHGQDEHGQKMSKSKGNFIVAQDVIAKYSADAFRYWAATAKLGEDLPYQEKDVLTGQKFVTKLWNASKFALMHLKDYNMEKPENLEEFDKWILSKMQNVIELATAYFDKYEYSRAKHESEKFFWQVLCENYLEVVKDRLYNPDKRGKEARLSAQYTLYNVLLNVLKLMAPITPHITEEIYHAYFKDKEKAGSVHVLSWPKSDSNLKNNLAEENGDKLVEVLAVVRKAKTEKQLSLKEPVKKLVINLKENEVKGFLDDLKAATKAEQIEFGDEISVEF